MSAHGAGCLCTGNPWEDRYTCPWYPGEQEISGVPFSLYVCRICEALLSWETDPHMRWHERMGHLAPPEASR